MKKDLLTGEEFEPQRINQKFKIPANRIAYYNRKANKLRQSVSYITKPILKNFKIFNELLEGKNEAVFHNQFLAGKGVSFDFYTHIEKYEEKNRFAIYNFITIPLENNETKIIKK